MLNKLIGKDIKFIEKKVCLDSFDEAAEKLQIVYALLKEIAKQEKETVLEKNSPIPLLCECYFFLTRLSAQLSSLIVAYADKARIKISSEEKLIYEAYYFSLEAAAKRLKYEFNILLASQKEIQ
jgi:hypothetical protein